MSTVPGELRLAEPAVNRPGQLSRSACIYLGAVLLATLAVTVPLVARIHTTTHGWSAFIVLSTAAAIAQLFVVRTVRDQQYHTSSVFLIAGALLLKPEFVVLMGTVQHVPEWLKHRYPWYIQTFNICNFTLDGLAAWAVAALVLRNWTGGGASIAAAGLAACVVFVALNHALMAGMLYFARGHRPAETGLFSGQMLSTELVLAAVGIGVATFWHVNPALIPFALAPLLLIHRALHVPQLEEQARVDSKTGLFNPRHFSAKLADELTRAQRFDRPLSVVMADLDLLREVNNTHGHLVGDEVLAGVAAVFRRELRDYDVPARFGGEEFAVLLPETTHAQALEIAERIRTAVADCTFDLEKAAEPIRVTLSLGVASFPTDGDDPTELIHNADLAVYRAKLQGRNRVVSAGADTLAGRSDRTPRLVALPPAEPQPERRRRQVKVATDRRRRSAPRRRWILAPSLRLGVLVALVGLAGIAAGVLTLAYGVLGILALGLAVLPLLLMRRTQAAYLAETARSSEQLRAAAETIRTQNMSLERANRLLRERSTAAMESLTATVDARDSYTAGHSRRVSGLAVAVGRELGLSQAELDLLGHAALFHDIGKLAIPDAILMKPEELSGCEWSRMRAHADEGARIIDRLGFLSDAVPAIRHHHERFDGAGYPDGLAGEEIPLGARIIHVADALDSMLTQRIYRDALTEEEALDELRRGAGTQFCPRCVRALEAVLPAAADERTLLAV